MGNAEFGMRNGHAGTQDESQKAESSRLRPIDEYANKETDHVA